MDYSPSLKKAQTPQLAFAVALISAQLYLFGLPALAKAQPPEPEEIPGSVGVMDQQDPTSLSPQNSSSPESLSDRSAQGSSTIVIYSIVSSDRCNLTITLIILSLLIFYSLLQYSMRREVIKTTEGTLLIGDGYKDGTIILETLSIIIKLLSNFN